MAYPVDQRGLWQEIRDTFNYNHVSTASYPDDILGILRHINVLLGGSTSTYTDDIRGTLQRIRDVLNTGSLSIAAYGTDIRGVQLNIRDLLNAASSSTSIYSDDMYGRIRACRDFLVTSGWPVTSAQATAFLARTSGLDATHTNAYTALINGLVLDGVWAKLDMLHIYATQNTTTAQLNLISSSFPASLNGSPVFTTDRGYQGVQASSTVVIDTGFNPVTATTPKYVQNSAHLSCWSVTSVGDSDGPAIGLKNGANESTLYPKYPSFGSFFRINGTTSGGDLSNLASQGFFLGSRTAAAVTTGYLNGTSLGVVTETSVAPTNNTFFTLAERVVGGPAYGSKHQLAMASIGGGLSSTDAANFNTRLRTYMTVVGVP